jgi:hypothetical protein
MAKTTEQDSKRQPERAPTKGRCPECDVWHNMTRRGRMRVHEYSWGASTRVVWERCSGSGGTPDPRHGLRLALSVQDVLGAHGAEVAMAGEVCVTETESGEWDGASRSVFRFVLTRALAALDAAESGGDVEWP